MLALGPIVGVAATTASSVGPSATIPPLADSAVVYEYSYSTGTGPYTLAGAFGSWKPFSSSYADGAPVYYRATDQSGQTEYVVGTFNAGAGTLSRDTIIGSTNDGNPIDWTGRTRVLVHALIQGLPLCATPPTDGQVLVWDGTLSEWCPATLPTIPPVPPSFAVCPTPPLDGQVLIWSAAENAYCPADLCTLVAACTIPPAPSACGSNLGQRTTWSPTDKDAVFELSNFGFTWTVPNISGGFSGDRALRTTNPVTHRTGKWYFLQHIDSTDGDNGVVLGLGSASTALDKYPGRTASVGGYSGNLYLNNGPQLAFQPVGITGYQVGAVDLDANLYWAGTLTDDCMSLAWSPGVDPATGTGGTDISSIRSGDMYVMSGSFVDGRGTVDCKATLFTNTGLSQPTLAGFTPWDG